MYIKSGLLSGQCKRIKNDIKVTQHKSIYMVKNENKNTMCNEKKVQNNEMCKTIDVQKTKRKKKTVYWDLINSNVNKRDVQTGCSGYVHPSGILPFHTVISFIFRRCYDGGDMLVINASDHITSSPISRQPDIFYEVANSALLPDSQKDVIK